MSKIVLIVLLLLISGCQKETQPDDIPKFSLDDNLVGRELEGTYSKDNGELTETNKVKNYKYANIDIVQQETEFFVENNNCIFDEYIVGLVTSLNESTYFIEIGSHCNELDLNNRTNGGNVRLFENDIPFEDFKVVKFFDQIKIYYEFPEGFSPESYLDYVNHATKIEIND